MALGHHVTGCIVDNEEEAIAAIKRIGELDRRRVRATFEQRFTAKRMAEDYIRHYGALLGDESRRMLDPIRTLNGAEIARLPATPQT